MCGGSSIRKHRGQFAKWSTAVGNASCDPNVIASNRFFAENDAAGTDFAEPADNERSKTSIAVKYVPRKAHRLPATD
jgi:hypothetical protein